MILSTNYKLQILLSYLYNKLPMFLENVCHKIKMVILLDSKIIFRFLILDMESLAPQ